MNPEEKELLQKTYKLTEENNEILKGMRRSQRMGSVMKALYWILIIVGSIAGYYFAQVYIQSLLGAFGDKEGNNTSTSSLIEQYKDLLQQ
jgi:hypothetical protein